MLGIFIRLTYLRLFFLYDIGRNNYSRYIPHNNSQQQSLAFHIKTAQFVKCIVLILFFVIFFSIYLFYRNISDFLSVQQLPLTMQNTEHKSTNLKIPVLIFST